MAYVLTFMLSLVTLEIVLETTSVEPHTYYGVNDGQIIAKDLVHLNQVAKST